MYERLWKNERNRTLLISSIIAIGSAILSVLFASFGYDSAPAFLKVWYYVNQEERHYSWGLTVAEIILLVLLYFFMLIAIATYNEIRAKMPSWGTIMISATISLLFTWFVTSIHPINRYLPTNFTSSMQWTIFGTLYQLYISFLQKHQKKRKDKKLFQKKKKPKRKLLQKSIL